MKHPYTRSLRFILRTLLKTNTLIFFFLLQLFLSCTKQSEIVNTETSESASDASQHTRSDIIYLTSSENGSLTALNAKTGKIKWQSFHEPFFYDEGVPCIKDTILYIKNSNNFGGLYILAVNAISGKEIWNKKLSDRDEYSISSPCISEDGILYVASEREVYALDVNTRKVKWGFRVTGRRDDRFSSPTVVAGAVYIADERNMYSFDAITGVIKWTVPDDRLQVYPSSPTVQDGHVIYTTYYSVESLDTTNGAKQWSYPVPFLDGLKSVAYNNGIVYSTNSGTTGTGVIRQIFALNATNGKVIWNNTTVGNSIRVKARSNVCYRNNVLYVPLIDTLLACDATNGSILWKGFTGTGRYDYESWSEPCATSDAVYITGNDFNLYALNIATGSQLWKFNFLHYDYLDYNPDETPIAVSPAGVASYPTESGMEQ